MPSGWRKALKLKVPLINLFTESIETIAKFPPDSAGVVPPFEVKANEVLDTYAPTFEILLMSRLYT